MSAALQTIDDDTLAVEPEPQASSSDDPRPADLRSKEGREWKKRQQAAGRPIELFASQDRKPAEKTTAKKSLGPIKDIIKQGHAMLAVAFDKPVLAIGDEASELLADKFVTLLDYYKIKVDGKKGAMLGVCWAVIVIYGPIAFTLIMEYRLKAASVGHNGGPSLDDTSAQSPEQ